MPETISKKYNMNSGNLKKLVEFWIEASDKDLHSAIDIFEKTKSYVAVLFYLHLSIEKILKASYVYNRKKHAPFPHNLLFLCKESSIDVTETDMLLLTEINEFNIECRYPDEKFLIYKKAKKAFTKKYLNSSIKFHKWIKEKLKNG